MSESQRVVATLKRLLKAQGHTYRSVGKALQLSEPSVKRMFSKGAFTLERLVTVASLLGMSLAEVAEQANEGAPAIRTLTEAQERQLTAETELLLVAACVVNGWAIDEIIRMYKLTRVECLKRLLELDRIGLITLLPGDRIRLNVARDFDWLPNGPIEQFFRGQKADFLASDFTGSSESFYFVFGMFTADARAKLRVQLRKLREEFFELHRETMSAGTQQPTGGCMLVALRDWEPRSFARLRRGPTVMPSRRR